MKQVKTRNRKKPSVRFPKKGRMIVIGVIFFTIISLFITNYFYTEWKHKTAVLSLNREYEEILKQELAYEGKGEVLAGATPKERAKEQKKIPIILYHYVEVVKDDNDTIRKSLNINPYIFEKHLKDISEKGYKTYFVKDIPKIMRGEIKYSTKSAVLTFDDGYEDFYTDALPLLKKYKVKATLYVVYDFIGRKGFLNKKQLSEIIQSNLVEIGSHAINHIGMGGLPLKQAKFEIKESKNILEEILGIEIKSFAYPYGSFDDQAEILVKDSRYQAAVSVIPGAYHTQDDLFRLNRYRAGMFGDAMVEVLEALKK